MRHLSLAVLCGTLLLAACNDTTQQAPTEPQAVTKSAAVTATCNFSGLTNPNDVVAAIFAPPAASSLLSSARDKVSAITKNCSKGKIADIQKKAFQLINWTLDKYAKGQLPSAKPVDLARFFSVLLGGVGVQNSTVDPGIFGPGGGVAVYDPDVNNTGGTPVVVKNKGGTAAGFIPAGAFGNEATLITIIPLPNSNQLDTSLPQSSPYFDYNASNASGNHTSLTDAFVIGFCVGDLIGFANPQIGHNPVAGAPGFPFEILDPATAAQYASLGLSCPTQINVAMMSNGAFSQYAFGLMHAAEAMLLPQPLHAAVLATGGLGGSGRSLSPFGVVDAPNAFTLEFGNDPGGETFYEEEGSTPLRWCFSCEPTSSVPSVILRDGEGTPIGGVAVTVTLIPTGENTNGNFTDGSTTAVVTNSDESAYYIAVGEARFDDLYVENVYNEGLDECTGTYKLRFTAEGAAPLESGEFTVNECGG